MIFRDRKIVSFSGYCPLNCKHCYTYELPLQNGKNDLGEIPDIVESLADADDFDVIYVSRSRENFIDETAGAKLLESLYEAYHKPMLVITRKDLSNLCIERLAKLNKKMKQEERLLTVAVSVPANKSYCITEDAKCVVEPESRCMVLKHLHEAGIHTIFMARPVFPREIIPTTEIVDLIVRYAPNIDAVVASGLAINEHILQRLKMKREAFRYLSGNHAEFLIGSQAENIEYIDVSNELSEIQHCCGKLNIPFSTHSMEALNSIMRLEEKALRQGLA